MPTCDICGKKIKKGTAEKLPLIYVGLLSIHLPIGRKTVYVHRACKLRKRGLI